MTRKIHLTSGAAMRLSLAGLTAGGLAGCSTMPNSSGPADLLVKNQYVVVDAAAIVDAAVTQGPASGQASATQFTPPMGAPATPAPKDLAANPSLRLSQAIARFYRVYDAPTPPKLADGPKGQDGKPTSVNAGALMRNDIQDQLIAASNVSCRAWKAVFSQWGTDVNFATKSLTTISSALGTAFTGVDVKSGFTAASSISSGVGSNYNEVYLRQKTIDVIFQAIDSRRQSIVQGLMAKRVNKDGSLTGLETYTLSQAIADGLDYHSACSVESGLQQVSEKLAPGAPPNPTSNKPSGSRGSATNGGQENTPAPGDNVALFDQAVPNIKPSGFDNSGSTTGGNKNQGDCTPDVTYGTASPALAGIAPRPCN